MELKEYKSELEICLEADALQNGCNPLGIAQTYRAIVRSLMDLGICTGMRDAACHAASRAVLGKLCSLAFMEYGSEVHSDLHTRILELDEKEA